jgi:hypothetical protein
MTTTLSCPVPNCQDLHRRFSTLHSINLHWRYAHATTPKTPNHADALNAQLCIACDKFVLSTPDGSMRRHNGCSRQTQPPAPDSGRDFARRATSTRQANTREQVTAEIIEEHPVRHHRLKGAEWSRHMSQLFAEYMTQSELGDYNRLTSIIVAILSSKPATTRPVSAQIHSQDQFWRARKALKILHTSGRKGKAMDALREGKPYVISAENEDEIRRLFLPRTSTCYPR